MKTHQQRKHMESLRDQFDVPQIMSIEEKYALRVPPPDIQHKDFTAAEYAAMTCTSYTGGASWLRSKAHDGFFVVACTPVEILKYFRSHPESTVRGQFIPNAEVR